MKYRKKPMVIEAMKFDGYHDNCLECYNWVNGVTERTMDNVKAAHDHVLEHGGIIIKTLEGDMITSSRAYRASLIHTMISLRRFMSWFSREINPLTSVM